MLTKFNLLKSKYLLPILLLVFTACAPDYLDITPTPTFTPVPTPTATPTPIPADAVQEADNLQSVLDLLLDNIPARLPAGAVEWRRDFTAGEEGVDSLPRVENGDGFKVFYTEQTGGQMNLSFAVFNTSEDAFAHFEFIRGIRNVLENGDTRDNFPEPNIFGAGLYGSVALFQIDNMFIEVNIELFSSTQGNPLVPLSQATVRFYEGLEPDIEALTTEDTGSSSDGDMDISSMSIGEPLLDAVLSHLPQEIVGDAIWTRDFERFDGMQTPPNVDNGVGVRVFYREQTGGALNLTFVHFDTVDDAIAHYEKFKGIRDSLRDENSEDGFPEPHVFGQGLYGSVALFQLDDVFIEVLIERAPGTVANPLSTVARSALRTLEEAQASLE